MKSGVITILVKNVLLATSLCLAISCSNSLKNDNGNTKEPVITKLPPKPPREYKGKLSQKVLEDYIQNSPKIKLSKKYKKPFDKLEFNKVIAYDYDGDEETFPSAIGRNGKFIPIIDKQAALTKKQVDYLINEILTSDSTYGGGTAACFQPHLSFIFYNENEPAFTVDVCLGCNFLHSSQLIPATQSHKSKFEDGTDYYIDGFSKDGKKRIRNLATELDFYYSNKNQNMH